MDNEQPWEPPEPQKIPKPPQIISQVPDVTIFSPSNNKPANNNFLQRALSNEKRILNIPKQQPLSVNNNPVPFNKVQPSVPDLSLFEPQVFNRGAGTRTQKPQSQRLSSKENEIARPSVPDVTILDEEVKEVKQTTNSTDKVFSDTYKKMLIKTHEQFMKQIKNDVPEEQQQVKKKSSLFNKYPENPLRKYAPRPSPPPPPPENDGNSSSILNFEEISVVAEEKADEMTFKKVAAMLSEIQKLVIPEKPTTDVANNNSSSSNLPPHKVLRHLATTYLTPEEFEYYQVDSELKEIEEEESLL